MLKVGVPCDRLEDNINVQARDYVSYSTNRTTVSATCKNYLKKFNVVGICTWRASIIKARDFMSLRVYITNNRIKYCTSQRTQVCGYGSSAQPRIGGYYAKGRDANLSSWDCIDFPDRHSKREKRFNKAKI